MQMSPLELEGQIIYRLASLHSDVTHVVKTVDELKTFIADLETKRSAERTALELRITKLEAWKNEIRNRIIGITSFVGVLWIALGDFFKSYFHGV